MKTCRIIVAVNVILVVCLHFLSPRAVTRDQCTFLSIEKRYFSDFEDEIVYDDSVISFRHNKTRSNIWLLSARFGMDKMVISNDVYEVNNENTVCTIRIKSAYYVRYSGMYCSKFVKTHPWLFGSNVTWVDIHYSHNDLSRFKTQMNDSSVFYKHWDRSGLEEEVGESLRQPRYDEAGVGEQLILYKKHDLNFNTGLLALGFFHYVDSACMRMAFQSWWEHNVILSFQDQLSMPIALSSCAFQVQPEHPCHYIGRAGCLRGDPAKHLFSPAVPLPALPGSANQAVSDTVHHQIVGEKSSVFHHEYRNWRVAEYKNYDYDKRKADMNSITDAQVKEFYHKNHIVVDEGISIRHKAMFSFFHDINFNRMLDIGCGCGHLVNWIMENKKSATVEGIDISCDHIDAAKTLYPAINVRCESVFDIEVSKFDMISMTDVLEHIREDDHDKLLDLLDKLSDIGTYLYINHPLASAVYTAHSQIVDIPIKLSLLVEMFSERNYILQYSQRWHASYMNMLFMKCNSNN